MSAKRLVPVMDAFFLSEFILNIIIHKRLGNIMIFLHHAINT